MWLVLTSSK